MKTEQSTTEILIIEDDLPLIKGLEYALRQQGFQTVAAPTFNKGKELISHSTFRLILLDVGLPDGDGFELCRIIRETTDTPIIFLTACDEEVHIVLGLDLGGDDYITKPFRINELISRIKAVLRRKTDRQNYQGQLQSGHITLDVDQCRVFRKNEAVHLTATEYRLLKALLENKGIVLSRDKLIEILWDREEMFIDSNTLSVYIRRLREKIEDDPDSPKKIITLRGLGYKWE